MTDRLVNLLPDALRLYPTNTPNRIDPATIDPTAVIPAALSDQQVHLGLRNFGPDTVDVGFPVSRVLFGKTKQPKTVLPAPCPETFYIVSLTVAVAHHKRPDLLTPYGKVRDLNGTVIGATGFARSIRASVISEQPTHPADFDPWD
jgi:hypothetical protein